MSEEQPDNAGEDGEDDDIRYFVRIGQADLDGTKSIERSLTDLKGIGHRAARVIADQVGVDRTATFGALEDDTIDDIVDTVEGFEEEVPEWLTNHRNDFFGGETTHEIGSELGLTRRQDINRMKMIDSYRGVRHKRGQKVRGQRTKSTGRTEGTIGVNVEAIKEEAAEDDVGEE
ncbi:30S ribosomal protein S13 [Halovenus rubra]|uniref:Small ribosomal subunit protein uS13 n=2 Tax=Halovenus rubra TaxID=869890 RepID=A0ABD5X657_9EURY|nr:30S ribosomal protein S13 [Halovenus rubra]